MSYFGLYVQLRRGSVAGYTTDERWAYGPKDGVEAFESITFLIRFIYAINFEHLLITFIFAHGESNIDRKSVMWKYREYKLKAKSVNKCCLFGTVSLPLRIYLIKPLSTTTNKIL